MQSQLLIYCRRKHRFTFAKIADTIGTTAKDYKAVEMGEKSLHKDQAEKLANLYKISGTIFYCEALQNHYLEGLSLVGKDSLKPHAIRSNLFLYLRRHFQGLSKKQAAEKVHISEEMYTQIEQGRLDYNSMTPGAALRRIDILFDDAPTPLFMMENSQTQSLYKIALL